MDNNGVIPCLPKLQSLLLYPGQVDPVDGVLTRRPFTVMVHFSLGLDKALLNSSSASHPKGLKGVKKTVGGLMSRQKSILASI